MINYEVGYVDGKTEKINAAACFISHLTGEKFSYIKYVPSLYYITADQYKEFVHNLALLPFFSIYEQSPEEILKEGFVAKHSLPYHIFLIGLSLIRYAEESQRIVITYNYLIKQKINSVVALYLAHILLYDKMSSFYITPTSSNHGIMNGYGVIKEDIQGLLIDDAAYPSAQTIRTITYTEVFNTFCPYKKDNNKYIYNELNKLADKNHFISFDILHSYLQQEKLI